MRIKETITREQIEIDNMHIDDEYCYNQFIEEREIENLAEKEEFMNIFTATGTYPF